MSERGPAPHPIVFSLLILPFGAVSGFVTVALNYLATRVGLTVMDGAKLVALSFLPHTWKFFWSPVVDTTLSRKRWYAVSAAACATGTLLLAAVPLGPSTFLLVCGLVLLTSVASTTLGMAVEGLMAHTTPPAERGRVGGWFQAGNLGGSGIGGGLGLLLLSRLPAPWMAGAVLAALYLACLYGLRFLPEVPAEPSSGGALQAMRGVGRDLWSVLRTREGQLCTLLCCLPIGTGAATAVLGQAEVAAGWKVGETEVALVNGVWNGVLGVLGCLAGGWLCGRWNARSVYAVIGAVMAGVAAAMALAPFTPASFVGFGLAYAFVTGIAFAAFSGFVLDAIGAGAAATKYNAFATLSNIPIMYMGLVLARAQTRHGSTGMLFTEAGAALLGLLVLAAVAGWLIRPRVATSA